MSNCLCGLCACGGEQDYGHLCGYCDNAHPDYHKHDCDECSGEGSACGACGEWDNSSQHNCSEEVVNV